MIRQSQHYFAAAVSAAVLNAAAVAAFVLFMLFSSGSGAPFGGLLGALDSLAPGGSAPAPAAGPSQDARDISTGRGLGDFAAAAGPAGDRRAGPSDGQLGPSIGGPGSIQPIVPDGTPPPSGGGGSGGSGGATGPGGIGGLPGPVGGAPDVPSPALPPALGNAIQQVGGTVSGAPAALNSTVNETVGAADAALGGALSGTGVSSTVQGASSGLLGPQSPVGQVAATAGGAVESLGAGGDSDERGGALNGLGLGGQD